MVDRVPKALNLSTKRSRFCDTDDGEQRRFPEEALLAGYSFRPGPNYTNFDRYNFPSHSHSSASTSCDFPFYPSSVPPYSHTFEAAFINWEDTQPCDLRLKRAKVASPPQPLKRVDPTLVKDLTACVALSKHAATADPSDNSHEACLPVSASSTCASESGMPGSSFTSCSSYDPELSASSSSQVHFDVGFDGRRDSCGYQTPIKEEVEEGWCEEAHGPASFVSSGYSSVASLRRQISETSLRSLRSQSASGASLGYQPSSSTASLAHASRDSLTHPSGASLDHHSRGLFDHHSKGSIDQSRGSVDYHSRGSVDPPSRASSAQSGVEIQSGDQESRVSLAQPKKKLFGRQSSTSSSLGYQSSSSQSNQASSSAISSSVSSSSLELHNLSSAVSLVNPASDSPSTYSFRRPRNLSVSLSASPLSAPTPEPASKEGRLADYLADCLLKYGLCIVDSYMGTRAGQRILKDVKERANQLREGRLMSDELESHTVRGDETMWLEAGTSLHIDNLVHRLDTVVRGLAHRLDATYQITSRTKAMVARYSGSGKCYVRHVDNHRQDGRCITCIYYLNQNYSSESDGGVLRMYPSRLAQSIDVEPKFDRVIFFWSDQRTPHEVLPSFRERYAITVWYFDEIERQQAKQRMNQPSGGES